MDRGRPLLMPLALVSGVLLAGLLGVHLLQQGPPTATDTRPVVLPDQLAGLQPAESRFQFSQSADWQPNLAKVFGARPFDGRAYGGIPQHRLVNLVVLRGDASGKGDLKWVRKPYTSDGAVTCSRSFYVPERISGKKGGSTLHQLLVCWRTSRTLSVSVLVELGADGFEAQAAQAVDDVWALEQ